MIFVHIPHMGDKSIKTAGYDNGKWFIADSLSFGVAREMKESGEKGGTEDINIGVGEMHECTIRKSMDMCSMVLAQYGISGNSPGTVEIDFVEVASTESGKAGKPICYLKYLLERCFIKSWQTSGEADDRPTEDVAFYYNKIAFNYAMTPDGKHWEQGIAMEWDNTTQTTWESKLSFNHMDRGWKGPGTPSGKKCRAA